MSRVREKLFEAGPVFGGLAFFPYQLAKGLCPLRRNLVIQPARAH